MSKNDACTELLPENLSALSNWLGLFRRILTKRVPFPRNFDKRAMDFISHLLEKSARRRLGRKGVEEIKKHPFLADIDWQKCELRELEPPIVPKVSNEVSSHSFGTLPA